MVSARHFIFGYGSLICSESRAKTAASLRGRAAFPVVVNDLLVRTWSARCRYGNQDGMTAVGVQLVLPDCGMDIGNNRKDAVDTNVDIDDESDGGSVQKTAEKDQSTDREPPRCTGVLIEVNKKELIRFDARESNYDRVEIPIDCIEPWSEDEEEFLEELRTEQSDKDQPIRIWAYVIQYPHCPSATFPIAQSYVDIILKGCLSISPEFASEFVRTTVGWSDVSQDDKDDDDGKDGHDDDSIADPNEGNDALGRNAQQSSPSSIWVDDRRLDRPIYIRADPQYSITNTQHLDGLLQKAIPRAFSRRASLSETEKDNA